MTVQELIDKLSAMPPMMVVWQQTHTTCLNRVIDVVKDNDLGIIELLYEK